MAKHLPQGTRLVEVGSAMGFFLLAAKDVGFDAAGIDISEYAVGQAPIAVMDRLTCGNAVALPWRMHSADVVCSWEFLEHVYEDEIDMVLVEMDRVLKPGGQVWHRIGIVMPGDPSHQQQDVTHYNERPRDYWESKFYVMGYDRLVAQEADLDEAFKGRDWADRFFVWRKP